MFAIKKPAEVSLSQFVAKETNSSLSSQSSIKSSNIGILKKQLIKKFIDKFSKGRSTQKIEIYITKIIERFLEQTMINDRSTKLRNQDLRYLEDKINQYCILQGEYSENSQKIQNDFSKVPLNTNKLQTEPALPIKLNSNNTKEANQLPTLQSWVPYSRSSNNSGNKQSAQYKQQQNNQGKLENESRESRRSQLSQFSSTFQKNNKYSNGKKYSLSNLKNNDTQLYRQNSERRVSTNSNLLQDKQIIDEVISRSLKSNIPGVVYDDKWKSGLLYEDNPELYKEVFMHTNGIEDEWTALVKYDSMLFEKENETKQKNKIIQQEKYRKFLDSQVSDKKHQQSQDKQETQDYMELVKKICEINEQKDQGTEVAQHKKRLQQNQHLKNQLKVQRKLKKSEQLQSKMEEENYVKRYKQDLKEFQDLQKERKQKELTFMQNVMNESLANAEFIKSQAKQIKQKDIEEAQEFYKFLEGIDQNRAQELANRKKKTLMVWERAEQQKNKDYPTIQRMKRELEAIDAYQKEKNDKFVQEEEQKKQKKKKLYQQMTGTLQKQVIDREQKKLQEKQIDRVQADLQDKDFVEYIREEQDKKQLVRSIRNEHYKSVKEQLEHENLKKKFLDSRYRGMNLQELLMHKQMLESASQVDQRLTLTKPIFKNSNSLQSDYFNNKE